MSVKKKKKKVQLLKNKMYLLVCFISIILVLLLILLGFKIFNSGSYYKIEPRVDSIKGKIDDNYTEVGWLRVQGTKIDLPVLYGKSFNEPFPMELEEFAWTENGDDKLHNMLRVVGHNLYNLSASPKLESKNFHRLEQLMNFVYYDFAKDNKYIQYTIDGKDYIYKVFASGFISSNERYKFSILDDYDKANMKGQIKSFKNNSLYKYDIDVNETDNLISLTTCTRFFGQNEKVEFFVAGRLLRDGEKIDNYKVTKSDNYKKVEKILKGDENNEEDTL